MSMVSSRRSGEAFSVTPHRLGDPFRCRFDQRRVRGRLTSWSWRASAVSGSDDPLVDLLGLDQGKAEQSQLPRRDYGLPLYVGCWSPGSASSRMSHAGWSGSGQGAIAAAAAL